jgi:hypothetical protein
MIHRFLRESEQLDLKLPPDYRSFKWMARHAFRFVWLDRAMARMAGSATQRCYEVAEEAAARRIALTCLEQLKEEKRDIMRNYVKKLSREKMEQYIESISKARCNSIKTQLILEAEISDNPNSSPLMEVQNST